MNRSAAVDHLLGALRGVTTDVPAIYRIYQTMTRTGRAMETAIVRQELTSRAQDLLLDIGCGPGDHAALFSSTAYTGIDIDLNNIQYARRRWPAYRFEHMDARHLGFPGAAFDRVVSMFTCHHLSDDDLCLMLKEAKRCLKDTGKMLIVDPVRTPRTNWMVRLLMRLDKGRWTRGHQELVALVSQTLDVEKEYLAEQRFMGIPFVPFDVLVIVASKDGTGHGNGLSTRGE